jgi:hypothetical protein
LDLPPGKVKIDEQNAQTLLLRTAYLLLRFNDCAVCVVS